MAGILAGRYELQTPLGVGGAAEVWKAQDMRLKRTVAVKIVRTPLEEQGRRLLRESEIAAKLQHSHIVPVFESGSEGSAYYFVMRHVNGPTLDAAKLSVPEIIEAIRQVATALHYAHGKGVIHRDIKPSNILIEGTFAYLSDFGLAKQVSVDASVSIVGTPKYMSPEHARSPDARSDVYSLGAVLYEMLGGKLFEGDLVSVVSKIVKESLPPLNVPPNLNAILFKAMEKDPTRRYATAQEFADDLERYQKNETVLARKPRRHGWVALLLIPLAAFAVYASIPKSASEKRDEKSLETLAAEAKRHESEQKTREFYLQSQRELHLLRVRSYRADWRLIPEEYEGLIKKCEEQMKTSGPSADGWWIIGRTKHVLGDWPGAVKAYNAGLSVDPNHAWCLLHKGVLLIEEGMHEYTRARISTSGKEEISRNVTAAAELVQRAADLKVISEIDVDVAQGYSMYVRKLPIGEYCDRMLEKWKGKDFAEEFLLIKAYGEKDRVIELTTQAIDARPGFCEALLRRGGGYILKQEYEVAIADLNRLLEINPRFTIAYENRAWARFLQNQFSEAAVDFTLALDIDPTNSYAYFGRASCRRVLRDAKGASEDIEKCLQLKPNMAHAYAERALQCVGAGETERAWENLDRAIELNPEFAEALSNRAILRLREKDYDGAMNDANRAIQADPKVVNAYYQRARALLGKNQAEQALKDLGRAIELNSRYYDAYSLRLNTLDRMGRHQEALKDCHKCVELAPRNFFAYWNRGAVYYNLSMLVEARADMLKAKELEPKRWNSNHQKLLDQVESKLKQ